MEGWSWVGTCGEGGGLKGFVLSNSSVLIFLACTRNNLHPLTAGSQEYSQAGAFRRAVQVPQQDRLSRCWRKAWCCVCLFVHFPVLKLASCKICMRGPRMTMPRTEGPTCLPHCHTDSSPSAGKRTNHMCYAAGPSCTLGLTVTSEYRSQITTCSHDTIRTSFGTTTK